MDRCKFCPIKHGEIQSSKSITFEKKITSEFKTEKYKDELVMVSPMSFKLKTSLWIDITHFVHFDENKEGFFLAYALNDQEIPIFEDLPFKFCPMCGRKLGLNESEVEK